MKTATGLSHETMLATDVLSMGLQPAERLAPDASVCWYVLLGFVVPCALLSVALGLWWRHRRKARVWQSARAESGRRAGGVAVLNGVVEGDPESGPVLSVDIEQRGRQWLVESKSWKSSGGQWKSKEKWVHSWKEVSRTLRSRPFYLVIDSGERVWVEPGDRAILAVAPGMLTTRRTAENVRIRSARVVPGERVWVVGVLHGTGAITGGGSGYRSADSGVIVRPPRNEPMLISSFEAPPDKDRLRCAKLHAGWAVGIGVLFVVVHALLFPYEVLMFTGRVVYAEGTRCQAVVRTYVDHNNREQSRYHYVATAAYRQADGSEMVLRDEVSASLCNLLWRQTLPVPFVVAGYNPRIHQVGSRPTLSREGAFFVGFLLTVSAVLYRMHAVLWTPWYMRRRLVERGQGPL